jgi:pimeloyl-ACP methyl ester carboxylesterase/thioredoxin reductase
MAGHPIAVIGAGPHGLSALKALLQCGIPAVGYEREAEVGGNWNFGAENSRVYRSTHLISSKPFTQFPDFPMPDAFPDYPSHAQVKQYLTAYARHFGLLDRIRFGQDVVAVEPVGDGWRVTARDRTTGEESTDEYAGVVIANGHNWNGKMPSYPGQDEFAGQVIHSAQYKDSDILRGRRVLVVGAGNTGCDIAVESAQNAERTWHSTRRGYYYNPKYAMGRPSDQTADLLLALRLPLAVRRRLFKTTLRLTVGDLTQFGLKEPDHEFFETHPIVNQQLVYYVGHGDITPVDDIDHFDRDGVVFADGRRADVDLVIFCTGYLATFPFLPGEREHLNWQGDHPRLGLQIFTPAHRTIFVSGLIQPDSGQWTLAHWQGMTIAHFLRAAEERPDVAERFHSRVTAEAGRTFSAGATYKESSRHYYEVAHQEYLEALEEAIGSLAAEPVRAMRPWDWAVPPRPITHREIVAAQPESPTGHPPLLMVHGIAHGAWCFAENWLPAAAEQGFPAYAVSLRGHGGSGGARHLRSTLMRDYVHDVLQAITELPEPPVLIGHSMGAVVAQLVAERYPLRGLVLLTPAPLHSAIGDLVSIGRDRPADLARAVLGRTLSMEPDILFRRLDPPTARRYSDRTGAESPLVQWELLAARSIGPVECPVLVVGTPEDRLVRVDDVRRTAARFGVEPVWFPGMGHDVMLDGGWDEVLDVVLGFVRGSCESAALASAAVAGGPSGS